MAKETVKAVRDAEIAAEKLIKEALEKKDAILSEARKKAGENSGRYDGQNPKEGGK